MSPEPLGNGQYHSECGLLITADQQWLRKLLVRHTGHISRSLSLCSNLRHAEKL